MPQPDTLFSDQVLLGVAQAAAADAEAEKVGIPSFELMTAAGRALARAVSDLSPEGPVAVLCGPGNNGGDGFVAARFLAEAGRDVRLALLGQLERLKGDAAVAAQHWAGEVISFEAMEDKLADAAVVLDAVFGAGLSRPVEGAAARLLSRVIDLDLPVVAADVPSGIDGDTGLMRGVACRATVTVTFYHAKPGHYLLPGRTYCGRLMVADIGIPESALPLIGPQQWLNKPALWHDHLPRLVPSDHKYSRGFLLVFGGRQMSGAARLAARAARRIGTGLVRVAAPAAALPLYAVDPGLLTVALDSEDERQSLLADQRQTAYLAGPGNGLNPFVRKNVLAALQTGRPCVLDADALTIFADEPARLFEAIRSPCVLTPHEGEFARLFPDLADVAAGKPARARQAARQAGAVVVMKGGDTVIAGPDGRAVINNNAPPWLATGGSGDVLAGLTGGLLAQGLPPFEAACAAVWIHGAAAGRHGVGMIAEDLPLSAAIILRELLI